MLKSSLAGAALSLLLCTTAFAQDYTMSVNNVTGASGSQVTIEVTVSNAGPTALALEGWSYGVCHNGAGFDVAVNPAFDRCLANDAEIDNNPGMCFTTQAVRDVTFGLQTLFFNNITVFYAGAGFDHPGSDATCAPLPPGLFTAPANSFQAQAGYSQAIVFDQNNALTLPAGNTLIASACTVDLTGPAGTYDVTLCDGVIGTPPVDTVVVVGGGSSVTIASGDLATTDGSVTILSPNFLTVETVTGLLGQQATTNVLLTNVGDIAGMQLALTFPDTELTLASATAVGAGAPACFFEVQPGAASGELAIGLIMDYGDPTPCGQGPIPAGTDQPVIELVWDTNPAAVTPVTANISFVDGIGSPPVDSKIIFPGGATETPNLVDGAINIVNFNPFVRGDCNQDGNDDIADGIFLLIHLFPVSAGIVCEDACDFNDDGTLDIADAAQLFNYRLQPPSACATPCAPPAAPFPTAGIDPTPNSVDSNDLLGCDGDADDGLMTFP